MFTVMEIDRKVVFMESIRNSLWKTTIVYHRSALTWLQVPFARSLHYRGLVEALLLAGYDAVATWPGPEAI